MGRAPCCDKANVKKGPWSPEEDAKLKSYIDQHGTGGNWIALPQKIGLKRCGKSCRLRWLNYLRPNIKHGGFSKEEDNIICSLYISIGSRWSIIAAQLPGRTDNDIKNYWNTRLKKKLLGKQRNGQAKGKQNSGLNYQHAAVAPPPPPPPPPPLPVLQPIPYSDEEPRFNNHTSIRRLLIKLGGRFSSEDEGENLKSDIHQYQFPADQALVQPTLYNNLIHSSDHQHQIPLPPLPNEAHILDLVGTDDDHVMYENPQRLQLQGLEFIYDDHEMIMHRGSCTRMDWGEGEMNPNWVFAASASNSNQCFVQESILEEFGVDKLRYPST